MPRNKIVKFADKDIDVKEKENRGSLKYWYANYFLKQKVNSKTLTKH